MASQINKHVERLHRHLPFGPKHEAIYEENQLAGDSIEIPTRAKKKLIELAKSPGVNLILLTGDAGHGKTFLCRSLMQEHLGYTEGQARALLTTECDGRVLLPGPDRAGSRPLRIYKDLSEMDVDLAVVEMEAVVDEEEALVIVCVNEGRLRAILEKGKGGKLLGLYNTFSTSFQTGLASEDFKSFVLNLNYQAVGSIRMDGRGLVRDALSEWLDGRRWQICKDCDCREVCPILYNHDQLFPTVSNEEVAVRRQQRVVELFAATERLGTVVTIRELLMTLAYVLTGGLHCKDVHSRKTQVGWQHDYSFYSLLFEAPPDVKRDNLERIPVLSIIQRLDPGLTATRKLDDAMIHSYSRFPHGAIDLSFRLRTGDKPVDAADGIESIQGECKTNNERLREAQDVLKIIRALRRKDYFDSPGQSELSTFRRLGFESYDDFLWILEGKDDPRRRAEIKNRILAGLHTIQGLRIPIGESALHLVDPAFGRTTRDAAIIARKIPGNQIKILSQSEAWNVTSKDVPASLQDSVDWIERAVILRFGAKEKVDLTLNLLAFESVIRSASGYIPRGFYAHEIRRITNTMARIAEREPASPDSGIDLFLGGHSFTVSLEDGNIIQISGMGLA